MKRSFALFAVVFLILSTFISTVVPEAKSAKAASEVTPAGFVSGQWRVVTYQTAVADWFDDYGLKDEPGKKWALLIADVTNLGAAGPLI